MASKWPPVKNAAYTFRCVLFAQDDNQIKANPTIAAGDWKVSTDGAAFGNLATLPDVDPDSSVQVLVSLSAGEMNGDEIMVTAIDAAGDEWHSAAWVIHTVGQTFDTMDTNIDSILEDTGTTIPATLTTIDGIVDDILVDTGTTIPATLDTIDNFLDTEVAAILEDTGTTIPAQITALNNLSAAQVNAEVDTALADYDPPTKAELDSAVAPLALEVTVGALNDLSAADVNAQVVDVLRTDTLPDSYSADGAQPTIAQALLEIRQFLMERGVSGTTVTVTKPDGSTSAMTFTLDDASNPTSITRAS